MNTQDSEGMMPLHSTLSLDIVIAKKDCFSTTELLSKMKEPEAYFSEVDQEQLLCYSLLVGFVDIVEKLCEKELKLPTGNYNEDVRIALHLVAMGDGEGSAKVIIESILSSLKNLGQDKNMVVECDKRGRTILHEAALNGNVFKKA